MLTAKDTSVSKADFEKVNVRWFNKICLWAGCYCTINVPYLLAFHSPLLNFTLAFTDSTG